MKIIDEGEYANTLTWNHVELIECYIGQAHYIDARIVELEGEEVIAVIYRDTSGFDLFTMKDMEDYMLAFPSAIQSQYRIYHSKVELMLWMSQLTMAVQL